MPKNAVLEYQSMDSLKFYFFGALKEADIVRYPIKKRLLIWALKKRKDLKKTFIKIILKILLIIGKL